MNLIGYSIVALALYLLFVGQVFIGVVLFTIGGYVVKKLFISLRSLGVVLLVGSISYGLKNGFTAAVLFIMLVGFVMGCFNRRRTENDYDPGWGIDIGELLSDSDSSDSGFGGDGGGD